MLHGIFSTLLRVNVQPVCLAFFPTARPFVGEMTSNVAIDEKVRRRTQSGNVR